MKLQVVTWLAQNRYPYGGRRHGIGVSTMEVYHTDLDWAAFHKDSAEYLRDWQGNRSVPTVADYNFFYGLTCR